MGAEKYGSHDECKPHVPYVLSNWCFADSLDGKRLESGDELEITWRDGNTSRATVRLRTSFTTIGDMGQECAVPISRAYVPAVVHGADTHIRLVEAGVTSAVLIKSCRVLDAYESARRRVERAISRRRIALMDGQKP